MSEEEYENYQAKQNKQEKLMKTSVGIMAGGAVVSIAAALASDKLTKKIKKEDEEISTLKDMLK